MTRSWTEILVITEVGSNLLTLTVGFMSIEEDGLPSSCLTTTLEEEEAGCVVLVCAVDGLGDGLGDGAKILSPSMESHFLGAKVRLFNIGKIWRS